ncbi:MAG: aldolase/citrate lyase family protein [Mycobacterium sp.]
MRTIPHSWLFTPATNTTHYNAAAAVGAEALILDLEDSVAPADKNQARCDAVKFVGTSGVQPVVVAVRINALDTLDGWRDLVALCDAVGAPDFLVIPKARSATAIGDVKRVLHNSGKPCGVIAIAESAAAVHPDSIYDPRVVDGVLYGSADMAADLGAAPQAVVVQDARSAVLHHAVAARIPVIDGPFFDLTDSTRLEHAVGEAVREGFAGKAAIHPAQVAAINTGFAPTDDQICWAIKVLEANRAGAATVDGQMVDEAIARRARHILAQNHQQQRSK